MTSVPHDSSGLLPVFVLRRGVVGERALGALRNDPRLEIIVADDRKPGWISAAQRAAAVVVATNADPLSALVYVLTAGVTAPILVAAPRRLMDAKRDVVSAGAAACMATPISRADANRVVKLLGAQTGGLRVDDASHLVLDPIERVVRFHTKTLHLSQREFAVLHCLSNRGGHPVSAVELLASVWGERAPRERTREILDVYIAMLRKKLRRLGLPRAICTVRGFGYSLGPVTASSS